jgi:predicted nucleic acid-binding protein
MRYLVRTRRGYQAAQELWADADQVVSASITYVEAHAALAAGRRGRFWTAPELDRLQHLWEAAWVDVTVVEIDPLIPFAAELARAEPVSGCDAIQLAAAIASGCDLLATADRRLCAAARHQQVEVIDLDQVTG